jgi:hypothetical protein
MRRRAFYEAQRVTGLHNNMIRKLLLEQECRHWLQTVVARMQHNDTMPQDPAHRLHRGIEAWRQSHGFPQSGVGRGPESDRSRGGGSRHTDGDDTAGETLVQRLVADEVARRLDLQMNALRPANGTSVASRSRNDSSEERLEERFWRRCENQLSGIKAGLSAKAAALYAALAALESKMLMRVEDMRAKTLRECTEKCEDQLSGIKAGLSAKAAALDEALAASESKMLMRVEDMLKDLRAETTRECTKGCNEKAVRDKVQTDVTERLASASTVTSEKLMQVMMTLETRLRKSQETATREQEERNERLSSELELLQVRLNAQFHAARVPCRCRVVEHF